ncbi:mitochondrial fusion and transport protein ugo1, partial [Ascosphaera acerosa]
MDDGLADPHRVWDDHDVDSSEEEAATFFTSARPLSTSASSPSRQRKRRPAAARSRAHHRSRRSPSPPSPISPSSSPVTASPCLRLKKRTSLFHVLGTMFSHHGAFSIWKGTNATFVYGILSSTLNTFLQGLFSALLAVPAIAEAASSAAASASSPAATLGTSAATVAATGAGAAAASAMPATTLLMTCASSALAALVLAPIDTTRTYLMLTPAAHGPRNLLRALRRLGSAAGGSGSAFHVPYRDW